MLGRISSRELVEWMAYYTLEPWGEIQQEYRAALIASIVAETARDVKKKKEPFKPVDFMRETYLEKPEESEVNPDTVLFEKAKAIFGTLGAKKKE